MSEKEKMLNGEAYNSRDSELIAMYHKARKLMKELNNLDSFETVKKDKILSELLGFKGDNVWIEPPFFVIMAKTFLLGKTPL